MSQIKLADFNPPPFSDYRYFLFDSEHGTFTEHKAKTAAEQHNLTAGYASIVPFQDKTASFVALFLDERRVCLRLGDRSIELRNDIRATVTESFPATKTFLLSNTSSEIALARYFHDVDDQDSDLLEYTAAILNDNFGLTKFAYIWSASRAGRARTYPEHGLTDAIAERITDPFDFEHDVLD